VQLFQREDLRVLDAVSGEDLTEKTLAHALLAGAESVPRVLLRALARYRRGARQRAFDRHLERAIRLFERRLA